MKKKIIMSLYGLIGWLNLGCMLWCVFDGVLFSGVAVFVLSAILVYWRWKRYKRAKTINKKYGLVVNTKHYFYLMMNSLVLGVYWLFNAIPGLVVGIIQSLLVMALIFILVNLFLHNRLRLESYKYSR